MAGVLDPEELDALIEGAEAANKAAASGKFDLARQDFALQRLLPALNSLHKQFATSASQNLRRLVPSLESISIDSVAAMPFEDLCRRLPPPCSLALFRGLPDGAGLLVAMESELVFAMVDRYFGGSGGHHGGRDKFSVTEDSFTEEVHSLLTGDIALAWKALLHEPPTLALRSDDCHALEEFAPRDSMVAVRFVVSFSADSSAGLWLAVPWAALDALRERLEGPAKSRRGNGDMEWQQRLQQRLEAAPISLSATLAETHLSLKRIAGLKVGDIIELPSAEEVFLHLGDNTLFQGRLGSIQGNFAVRIGGRVNSAEKAS